MKKRRSIAALIAGCAVFLVMAAVANAQTVMVMDFLPNDVSADLTMKTSELLRMDLMNVGGFTVLMKSQAMNQLRAKRINLTHCGDVACAVDIGRALGVGKVLTGSIMRMGNSLVLNCIVVDAERGTGEFNIREIARNEDDIVQAVSRIAKQFSVKLGYANSGSTVARKNTLFTSPANRQPQPTDRRRGVTNLFGGMSIGFLVVGVGFAAPGVYFWYDYKNTMSSSGYRNSLWIYYAGAANYLSAQPMTSWFTTWTTVLQGLKPKAPTNKSTAYIALSGAFGGVGVVLGVISLILYVKHKSSSSVSLFIPGSDVDIIAPVTCAYRSYGAAGPAANMDFNLGLRMRF